jgi:hypothetical protein
MIFCCISAWEWKLEILNEMKCNRSYKDIEVKLFYSIFIHLIKNLETFIFQINGRKLRKYYYNAHLQK